MCGVVCIRAFDSGSQVVDREELRKIRDHMHRRGPDGAGEWFSADGKVGLGHRRLSIIDLSERGNQPMPNEDETLWIVLNGEIYNYRELRRDLESRGRRFRSDSDTEVVLHLYEEKGPACVDALRGMFAFCLWDEKKRTLMLARDPYGIKPLYYTQEQGIIRVASQVKALLSGGKISRDPNPAGVAGFFLWGSVPEPHTFYREIRGVEAGSYHLVGPDGKTEKVSYWSPREVYSRPEQQASGEGEMRQLVRETLLDSVRHHLVADVPVGLFLSAGFDSSTLLALASETSGQPIRTVTLAFEEYRGTLDDESVIAEQTAEACHAIHTTIKIGKEEFIKELPCLLDAMDQPSIDGANTYFVARAAAQAGLRVAISGLGGDEIFGGYPSFRNIPKAVKMVRGARLDLFGEAWRKLGALLPANRRKEKVRGMLKYCGSVPGAYFLQRSLFLPWEISSRMSYELLAEGLRTYDPVKDAARHLPDASSFKQVAALEQSLYMRNTLMRDSDWAGMAHSVEIRVPFVDRVVAESLAPRTALFEEKNTGKSMMIESQNGKLPELLKSRRKTGFSMPIGEWTSSALFNREQTENWSRAWARLIASIALLL